jgi:hypothetical protein
MQQIRDNENGSKRVLAQEEADAEDNGEALAAAPMTTCAPVTSFAWLLEGLAIDTQHPLPSTSERVLTQEEAAAEDNGEALAAAPMTTCAPMTSFAWLLEGLAIEIQRPLPSTSDPVSRASANDRLSD